MTLISRFVLPIALISILLAPFGSLAWADKDLAKLNGGNFNAALIEKEAKTSGQKQIQFRIELKKEVPFTFFTLENPMRLVIDLEKSSFKVRDPITTAANPLVENIRVGVEGSRVRLVLDLSSQVLSEIQMKQSENALIFTLGESQQESSSVLLADATSEIAVDKVWLAFERDERKIKDIHIKNRGDLPITLKGVVEKVVEAGEANESSMPSEDISISPKRMLLLPGEEKALRVMLLNKERESEENYRIVFSPELDESDKAQSASSIMRSLVVSISAMPEEGAPALDWEVEENSLKIVNNGNVSVFLDSGRLCEKDHEKCDSLPSRRIYPGKSWTMEVTGKAQAEFVQRFGDVTQQLIIPLKITVNIPSAA